MSAVIPKRVNRAPFWPMFFKSLWFGLIVGVASGWVKLGWEQVFPPRTLSRAVSNEPQYLLQQLGIPYDFTHTFVLYSDNQIQWTAFIVHFSFSIFFSFLFIFLVQYWRRIAWFEGAAYGVALWFIFHLIILPAIGNVPPMWGQPPTELFSECFGHIAWAWAICCFSWLLISKQRKKTLLLPEIGWGFENRKPSPNDIYDAPANGLAAVEEAHDDKDASDASGNVYDAPQDVYSTPNAAYGEK